MFIKNHEPFPQCNWKSLYYTNYHTWSSQFQKLIDDIDNYLIVEKKDFVES